MQEPNIPIRGIPHFDKLLPDLRGRRRRPPDTPAGARRATAAGDRPATPATPAAPAAAPPAPRMQLIQIKLGLMSHI